jgi:hypothetical protein
VLLKCKLVERNIKVICIGILSPLPNSWDCTIKKYGLGVEWMQFKVDGNQTNAGHLSHQDIYQGKSIASLVFFNIQ